MRKVQSSLIHTVYKLQMCFHILHLGFHTNTKCPYVLCNVVKLTSPYVCIRYNNTRKGKHTATQVLITRFIVLRSMS